MSTPSAFPPPSQPTPLILLILVGLPGSGKSTLAHALQDNLGWLRASQDDAPRRRRGECEDVVRIGLREGRNVVVDRVGFDVAQRAYFLQLAREPEFVGRVDCWCLVLDAPYETLKSRLVLRPFHPTLTDPALALKVLNQMSRLFAPPIRSRPEGFARVLYIGVERQPDGGVWDAEALTALLREMEGSGWREEVLLHVEEGLVLDRVGTGTRGGRGRGWGGGWDGGTRGWRGGYTTEHRGNHLASQGHGQPSATGRGNVQGVWRMGTRGGEQGSETGRRTRETRHDAAPV